MERKPAVSLSDDPSIAYDVTLQPFLKNTGMGIKKKKHWDGNQLAPFIKAALLLREGKRYLLLQ